MVLKVFSSPGGALVLCRGFCSMGIAQCAWERRHKARHPSRGGQSSGSKLLQTPPCLRQQPPAAPALSRLIQVKPRLQNASLKEILREGTWNEKSAAGLGFVHTQTKTVFFFSGISEFQTPICSGEAQTVVQRLRCLTCGAGRAP